MSGHLSVLTGTYFRAHRILSSKGNDGLYWSDTDTLFLFRVLLTEPAGSLRTGFPRIQELAGILDRTTGSVHRKLEDIRSNDPVYRERGRKGTNAAKLISETWSDLYSDYDRTMSRIDDAYESVLGVNEVSETYVDSEVHPGLDVPTEFV